MRAFARLWAGYPIYNYFFKSKLTRLYSIGISIGISISISIGNGIGFGIGISIGICIGICIGIGISIDGLAEKQIHTLLV